jgi:hypothetical protein
MSSCPSRMVKSLLVSMGRCEFARRRNSSRKFFH